MKIDSLSTVPTVALAAAVLLAGATLAACGGSSGTAASGGPATVTVGTSGNIFDMPLRVAEANGYFSRQGLKVKFVTLTASTTSASLTSGSVQFLNESPTGFLAAVQKGLPHIAVAANGLGNPLGLVVSTRFAQQHQLTTDTPAAQVAAALAGSTGGASSANTQAEAGIFLAANKVDPKGVKWVSLPNPAADKAALNNHQIDWFVTSEPLPLQIEDAGDGIVVADPLTVPQWSAAQAGYSQFIVAAKGWAGKNPATVTKFVTAVQDATKYMNEHPGDASVLKVATQALPGVPEKVLQGSLAQVEWPAVGTMSDADWAKTLTFVNELNTLDEKASVTGDNWTNKYLS
jgi:NitT/TauT family transport system substrate-binding protein